MKNEHMQSIKSSLAQIGLPAERKDALYREILARGGNEKGEKTMKTVSRGMRAAWIAAIILVLSFTLVACIPAARAEVLGWFGIITEPRGFLTADPEERNNEAVEELVLQAEKNQQVTILDRGAYGEVSESLCKAFENGDGAELLETLYDGKDLYISVKFLGDSGLWLLEQYTGATKTRSAIPVDKLDGYFGGNPAPDEYKSGEVVWYEFVEGWLRLKLDEQTTLGGMFDLFLSDDYPYADENTPLSEIDKINEEWIKTHEIIGTVQIWDVDPAMLKGFADENGIVTADVNLNMEIMLDGDANPTTKVFEAEIGSVKIDALAHERMEKIDAAAGKAVNWSGKTMLTVDTWGDDKLTFRNIEVDLDGLTMRPLGLTVSPVGVKNVGIEIVFPSAWTEEMRDAFMSCVNYRVLLNGEQAKDVYFGRKATSEGTDANGRLEMTIDALEGIPYDRIASIETVTLVPYITYEKTITWKQEGGNPVPETTWDLTRGDVAELPHNSGWNTETEETVFEDCALVYQIKK